MHTHSNWLRWWLALGLALTGLLLLLGVLTERSVTGRVSSLSPLAEFAEPPLIQQEGLWAEVGLNEAWYVANGYTDAPPPSAPSPFVFRSAALPGIHNSPLASRPSPLILAPSSVAFSAFADQPTILSATVNVSASEEISGWVAALSPGGAFTPTLVPTTGLPGQNFTLTVDTAAYALGTPGITHTRRITVSALSGDVVTGSQVFTTSLYVDPHRPRLWLEAQKVLFTVSVTSPGVHTRTIRVRNTGGYTLTWSAQAFNMGVTPLVTPTAGVQDGVITITLDSRDYPSTTDVYSGQVVVSATYGSALLYPVLDSPQTILVQLQWVEYGAYLPSVLKQIPPTPTPTPTPTLTPTPTPTPPPSRPEVRAIWVTRYDWTSLYESEGPTDVDEIVANVAGAGFNTIFFQVRAHGDGYYTPGLEPWSARLNDDRILGQDPGWDPLARMIQEAHARGIEVHAYLNVYPVWLGATAPSQDTTPQHAYWTWSYAYTWDDWRHWHQSSGPMNLNSGYLWASPGVDGVRDHVVAVAGDIVTRYDVDGVHLDLVRYANSVYSFDPISNAAAGASKTAARDQWQRDRVTDLVSRVYTSIRGIRPGVRLSAAVWFCYYADGCGYGLSSGYVDYYQDSLGWLAAGVIDAIAPMLYEWSGFDNLEIWRDVMNQFQSANAGRDVYPGISGDYADFAQIAARIQAARDADAVGHAIFSYGAVDARGYWDDFASGPYASHSASLQGLKTRNKQ